jgi:hypothetical protein
MQPQITALFNELARRIQDLEDRLKNPNVELGHRRIFDHSNAGEVPKSPNDERYFLGYRGWDIPPTGSGGGGETGSLDAVVFSGSETIVSNRQTGQAYTAPGLIGATNFGSGPTGQVLQDYATVGGGSGNKASGLSSVVAGGLGNTANALYSAIAGGHNNSGSAESAAIGGGNNNRATAVGATVPGGDGNTASGQFSFAAGFGSTATGQGAIAMGGACSANGDYAIAMGNAAVASAYGVAIGDGVDATGEASFATGNGSTATAPSSFAGGNGANATHSSSIALGNGPTASGNSAIAIGNGPTASGRSSVAIGGTIAEGRDSVGIGNARTFGTASIAFGTSFSSGSNSVAGGYYAVSARDGQFAIASGRHRMAEGSTLSSIYGGDCQSSVIVMRAKMSGSSSNETCKFVYGDIEAPKSFYMEDMRAYTFRISAVGAAKQGTSMVSRSIEMLFNARCSGGIGVVAGQGPWSSYGDPSTADWAITVSTNGSDRELSFVFQSGATVSSGSVTARVEFEETVLY